MAVAVAHGDDVARAAVEAAARLGDALHALDHVLAVLVVFEDDIDGLLDLLPLLLDLLHEADVLELLGDRELEHRERDRDGLFLDSPGIGEAHDEISDRVGDHRLPGRLLNARDIAFERFLAEADAAEVEIAHEAAWATALEATTDRTRRELRCAVRFGDH